MASLIPDESLTIDEGAVAPWKSLMWSLMTDICRAMGVRTDVPFRELTEEEKQMVYDGPMEKRKILYQPGNGAAPTELNFTYYSAVATVKNALSKASSREIPRSFGALAFSESRVPPQSGQGSIFKNFSTRFMLFSSLTLLRAFFTVATAL